MSGNDESEAACLKKWEGKLDAMRSAPDGKEQRKMRDIEPLTIGELRKLTALQADDEALWAPARYIETGYAQQCLRILTRAIEGELTFDEALAEIQGD